jgi:hypothetical protein
MPENYRVKALILQESHTRPTLERSCATLGVFRCMAVGVGSGDPACNRRRNIGMDPPEGPSTQRASEQPLQHPVTPVSPTEPVAMRDEAIVSGEGHANLFSMKYEPYLIGQIPATPPVVVPSHEMYGNARVDDLSEQAEHPRMPGRNDATPLEPEVEEIAV